MRKFLILVLAITGLLQLLATSVVADNDPITVVRRAYNRVLKPFCVDKQGRQLCVLCANPKYQKEDFTSEFYQFLLDTQQSHKDFIAGKRKNYWDQEVLTGHMGNNLAEWPSYRLKSQSSNRAIVEMISADRGFYCTDGQWQQDCYAPYSRDVEVVKRNGRWQFANIWFSSKKDLLIGGKEFLRDR